MKKYLFLPALLCAVLTNADAQKLAIPARIAPSYENGTRTTDGKPGKNWWQNRARYEINVNVAPPNKLVTGTEHIVYFNNSPHKLDSLNMKLIVNVHRAAQRNGTQNVAQGVTVDQLKINGATAVWDNAAATTTNYMLPLQKPLMPKDSILMDITWHFEIADGQGRDGAIDPNTFFLAYFYPRVSVFDDYQGWDKQPHLGSLEFYNDFNDYTLNVTAPKNFVVWATGTHTNPDKVLQPEYAKRLKESFTSDSTIHIVTPQDIASKNITAQTPTNTWTFTSTNISDVTAAISDHYNWDAGSVELDSKTHRRVSAQAAYDNETGKGFNRSVQFSRYSLKWFSDNWPGVPYPYEKSVAVQGFADMEYPMMMNDSPQSDPGFAQLVQDHEQAHTYMPFYMGINESYYAFMDEGWATTLEYLIAISSKGKKAADEFYKTFRVNGWSIRGKHDLEVPIITPSPEVTYGAGNNFYGKPSLSYLALKDYLGDDLFKKALHYYMNNWNGKHPIPWDYFNAMNAGSGKNLDWFFYNWFYTPYYIDLVLDGVKQSGDNSNVVVKNKGGFAVPFDVNVTYTDGSTESFHQTPAVWEKDQKNINIKIKTGKELKEVTLDCGIFVDANAADNKWKN